MESGDYVVTKNNYNKFMRNLLGNGYWTDEDRHMPYGITDDDMLIARVVESWYGLSTWQDDIKIKVLNHKSYSMCCGEKYDVNSEYFQVIDANLVNSYIDFMVENYEFSVQ